MEFLETLFQAHDKLTSPQVFLHMVIEVGSVAETDLELQVIPVDKLESNHQACWDIVTLVLFQPLEKEMFKSRDFFARRRGKNAERDGLAHEWRSPQIGDGSGDESTICHVHQLALGREEASCPQAHFMDLIAHVRDHDPILGIKGMGEYDEDDGVESFFGGLPEHEHGTTDEGDGEGDQELDGRVHHHHQD